jgi:terminase small subunit / prophage DNA-packing protein
MSTIDLSRTMTQAEFGDLVGISQPAVSDLLQRDIIKPGEPCGAWMNTYISHLREQAAGRGMDGELAFQRSELARVSRERAEIKLALERRDFAPVTLIEQVLATVGRSIVGVLEPLHVNLHRLCPHLTPEDLKLIQLEVSKACDIAASASLALLDVSEDATAQEPEPQLDAALDAIDGDDGV